MVKEGLLTEETARQVRADSLDLISAESEFRSGIAPHFVEWIRQQLLKKAEAHGYDIYRDGLRIYTSLDSRMQRYAISAIEEHLKDYQQKFDATWNWKEHPEIMSDVISKAIREDESYTESSNSSMRDSIDKELRNRPHLYRLRAESRADDRSRICCH